MQLMKNIITINHGFYLPKSFLYFGYILMLIGIVSLYENMYKGIGLIALGGFMAFTPCGIQLRVKDKLFRNYVSILGIKTGNWKSLKPFVFIALVGSRIAETTLGASTPVSVTTTEKVFNICLLSETHKEKLILKQCKDAEKAKFALKELSQKLGLEIVNFTSIKT